MEPRYCRIWLDKGQTIRSSTGVELRLTPSKALEPLALPRNASPLCWLAKTLLQGMSLVLPAESNPAVRRGSEARDPSRKRPSSVDRDCQRPSAAGAREECHCNTTYLSSAFTGLGPEDADSHCSTVILQLVAIDSRTKHVIVTKVIPRSRKVLDWKVQTLTALVTKRATHQWKS